MNVLAPILRLEIERLYLEGKSTRQVQRELGTHHKTVLAYFKKLREKHGIVLCECGEPNTHKQWCSARYKRSKKRQEFITRFGFKELGLPDGSIWMRSTGAIAKAQRRFWKPDIETLRCMYMDFMLDAFEIGRILGVERGTIHWVLKKSGIPLRVETKFQKESREFREAKAAVRELKRWLKVNK